MNIFQIHISDHDGPLPDPLRATAQSVRQFHPDATYELYNGSRLRSFIDEAYGAQVLRAYDRLKPYAFKADLGRLCLVHHFGGLYVDLPIRMNLPLRPAPEIQALLFRDLNLGLPYGWGVQNAFFYAQAGAAFLHKAIDLIVEHVERGDYGLMPFSVTGPGLFGRALALNGEKTGHVYGDRIPLTPLHAKKNFAFVLPDGAILAWAKQTGHGGDLTPYGETAGNNYMQMWKDRDIFRE